MRLRDWEINAIKESLAKHFGDQSKFYLFGSRVDDSKRGGDIDLYIETDLKRELVRKATAKAKWEMMEKNGEQRIDVVVHVNGKNFTPIEEIARETGVML